MDVKNSSLALLLVSGGGGGLWGWGGRSVCRLMGWESVCSSSGGRRGEFWLPEYKSIRARAVTDYMFCFYLMVTLVPH